MLTAEFTTRIIRPTVEIRISRNVMLLLQIIIPSPQPHAANQKATPSRLSMNVPLL